MDNTTRDIYALINAHNSLLKTLYAQTYKDNSQGLRILEGELDSKLRQPPQHPNPTDQADAEQIQPHTLSAIWVFFREVESKILEDSTE